MEELEKSLQRLIDAICDRLEEVQSEELVPQIRALQTELAQVRTTLIELGKLLLEAKNGRKDI